MTTVTKFFGPPGTGKTSRLINIVGQALESGLSPAQIVYVSFTKVAAEVAAQRARERFPWYPETEFKYFATVHSICFGLLGLHRSDVFSDKRIREFGAACGYEFMPQEMTNNDPFQQAIQDMAIVTRADFFEAMHSYWRSSGMSLDDAVTAYTATGAPEGFQRAEFTTYVARRTEYKKQNSLYDFSDMLSEVLERGLYPRTMKMLIADESQDNSWLLNSVLQQWVRRAEEVYLAGDPYQCIYGWSSADPHLFINFPADVTTTLKQSYRCPREVHRLSRQIVERFQTRYENDDFLPTDEPGRISREIDFDITEQPSFWLFRTRYLLGQTFDYLYFRGVPFLARRGRKTIFDEKKDGKRSMVARLLALPYEPVSLSDLARILQYLPSKHNGVTMIERGMKSYIKEEAESHPDYLVRWEQLSKLGFTQRFLANKDRDLLEHLRERDFAKEEKSYIRRLVAEHGRGVLSKKPHLELGTFHSVKGDEAVRVVIDPTYTRKPYGSFINGNEEEHRLIYTAITRSSSELVVLGPSGPMSYPVM